MAKKSSKSKSGVSRDVEAEIINMSPSDLAVEISFEDNAIDALKGQKKKDDKITELKKVIKALKETRDKVDEVKQAKEAYDTLLEEHAPEGLSDAEEDLAALNKGYGDDIRDRSKKLKFMKKTQKRHIESGALKRKS